MKPTSSAIFCFALGLTLGSCMGFEHNESESHPMNVVPPSQKPEEWNRTNSKPTDSISKQPQKKKSQGLDSLRPVRL